jgi:hypothetical protein
MFKNHKELVGFWKVRNLFEELSSLDNDVDCSLRQIANFHFNIKHPKSFDKAFQDLDKTVGEQPSKKSTLAVCRFLSGCFCRYLNPKELHPVFASHGNGCRRCN